MNPISVKHIPAIFYLTSELIDVCGKGEWDEKAFILSDEYRWALSYNEKMQPILIAYPKGVSDK